MPELPEVETLCRQLAQVIVGARIISHSFYDAKLSRIRGLSGKRILSVRRCGKWVRISGEKGLTIGIHLRMTGRLAWQTTGERPPHTRLAIRFDRGTLYLVDPRRFATVTASPSDAAGVPDALDELDSADFMRMAAARKTPVKSFLMNQRILTGIGNIYACEILYRAAISPWRIVCGITAGEWKRIIRSMRLILISAIACRGTSVSDWADLFGEHGEYQRRLRVYGREGKSCFRCGSSISRKTLSGRSTFFCPSCQAI